MADPVIHISEEEAARDFAGVMARVRAGVEVIIESRVPLDKREGVVKRKFS